MLVIEAIAASAGLLVLMIIGAKGMAYHVAMYSSVALKCGTYQLYSRMLSPLNFRWWLLALFAATLFCAAYVAREDLLLVAAVGAMGITVAHATIRSLQQVKLAARELGVAWPEPQSP